MDLARDLVREPDVSGPRAYRRRVGQLACVYLLLFCISLVGLVLIIRKARLLVLLAQRSNVETLTIAFFLLFFAYLLTLSVRGAWGGAHLALHHLRAAVTRDRLRAQRALARSLGTPRNGPAIALSHLLERADRPGQPFEITVADAVGAVGRVRIDGVTVRHLDCFRDGSNSLLAFFVGQVIRVLGIDETELDIVRWRTIDSEGWHEYVGEVAALQALGSRDGTFATVWPKRSLTAVQVTQIEERMGAIAGAVREEALLPRVEYEGEHKIPIIPEPLGIISLQRRERRVDALSSMGACLAVVVAVTAILFWFTLRPPWVPGA